MIIFQGEQIPFEGYLRYEDTGEVLTDFSNRTLSCLLKNDRGETVIVWTSGTTSSDAHPIAIAEDGKVSFTLPASITETMKVGAYVFEQMLSDRDGRAIGISKDLIKVCESNIGKIKEI